MRLVHRAAEPESWWEYYGVGIALAAFILLDLGFVIGLTVAQLWPA